MLHGEPDYSHDQDLAEVLCGYRIRSGTDRFVHMRTRMDAAGKQSWYVLNVLRQCSGEPCGGEPSG